MLLQPKYQVIWKADCFVLVLEQRRPFSKSRLLSHLDHMINPAEAMGLEVSVADRHAVWNLWQAPIGGSQKRETFGMRSKALPSSTDIYSPFERRFLACYWVLVEAECLIMSHQVTMQAELPIIG